MNVDLCTVGGYNEVGKNMTAVKIGNETIILDMGFYLPAIINFEEEGGDRTRIGHQHLIDIGAIPDDNVISSWKPSVKAIIPSHAHLDHIGAIPSLAGKYRCPILGTPYTMEVLKRMIKDDQMNLLNNLKPVPPNSSYQISQKIKVEFINMTHSTLQTAMVAIHTENGTIIYANDFKFDDHPIVGKKPNYKRLKEIGKGNVLALIVDSIYAGVDRKTPSEKVARELLKDVMLGTSNDNNGMIVTCFASHIARLKSIVDFGDKLGRKTIFLGRSLSKYVKSAESLGLVDFSNVEVVGFASQVKRHIQKINKNYKKYLVVCTGGQGEPGAVLTRMSTGSIPIEFHPGDQVLFSNKVIPVDVNISARQELEARLKQKKVRIFKDLHTSGHCAREDLRDLIEMVKPKHIIPAHGNLAMRSAMVELGEELGYSKKNIHLVKNGLKISI